MAFVAIPDSWIEIGEPTKKELFDRIQDNLDDLDSRATDLEAAITNETPIQFQVMGPYASATIPISDAAHVIRIPFDITLTSARLHVVDDGSSGTLDVDVKVDTGGGFGTIFSARPSIAQGGGANGTATGTLSTTDLDAGDFLRLDVITAMTGNERFNVYLTWEIRG